MKKSILKIVGIFVFFTLCLVNQSFANIANTDVEATIVVGDLDGQWSAKIQGPDGADMDLIFTFKVDGEKLTGTVGSMMGEMPINKGEVDGNKIKFEVDAGGMVIVNNGVLEDGKIVIKADIMGEMVETILTKI